MLDKLKIVVLISGRGSNLSNLINNQEHYKIVAVISNNPEAKGLQYANDASIPTYSFKRADYESLKKFKSAIREKVISIKPDFVVLAGFMQIIEKEFIAAFPARIINIHPSLLPKFPGLDTHKQALDNKATEHGCTVHLVDEGVDTGKIIAHARLEINQNETEESLAKRVLDLEHQIFPWVLNQIGLKNINIVSNLKVTFNDKARLSAKERFFNIEM